MTQQPEDAMTDLDLDLARASVALPGWQWMLGMLTYFPDDGGPDAPDYRDPATAGCLLAMLGPGAAVEIRSDGASVWDGRNWHWRATLGEACISTATVRGGWGVR